MDERFHNSCMPGKSCLTSFTVKDHYESLEITKGWGKRICYICVTRTSVFTVMMSKSVTSGCFTMLMKQRYRCSCRRWHRLGKIDLKSITNQVHTNSSKSGKWSFSSASFFIPWDQSRPVQALGCASPQLPIEIQWYLRERHFLASGCGSFRNKRELWVLQT